MGKRSPISVGSHVVGLLFLALFLTCLVTPPASAQTTPQIRYVDALNGSDTTGTGTQTNPWRSIRHALAQTAGLPWVKIRILDTAPTRHGDSIEQWSQFGPLQVPAGTTIEKWGATAPTIIDASGVSASQTPLVLFTSPGGTSISGSNTGLKNLHFYEAYQAPSGATTYNAIAVAVRGVGSGTSAQPTITGCVFSRCQSGVQTWVDSTYYAGTVNPSVNNCKFCNKQDAYDGTNPAAQLNYHVQVYTNGQGTQASPTISGCKFYPAPTSSGAYAVGYGVYARSASGGSGTPVISNSTFGYTSSDASAFLGVGVRSMMQSGGRLNLQLQSSTIRNCKYNGVELMSAYTATKPSYPLVDTCTITGNGFGASNPGWSGRHGSYANWAATPHPRPSRGHGIVASTIEMGEIEPAIQHSTISNNEVDGIHLAPMGAAATYPGGISQTWVKSTIKDNTIYENERFGVANIAYLSLAYAYISYNLRRDPLHQLPRTGQHQR